MGYAIPVQRGCGTRQENGVYFETALSENGLPIEHFLVDPPIKITPELWAEMGIANIGTSWIPEYDRHEDGSIKLNNGEMIVRCWHILDVIGTEHYPTVARFVEEARRFGISRRLAANLDFSRISRHTRLITVHAKAYIENTADYKDWVCPKSKEDHFSEIINKKLAVNEDTYSYQNVFKTIYEDFCCAGVWYQDEETGGENAPGIDPTQMPRRVEIDMPSFSFFANRRPAGIVPKYHMAIFGRFPIGRLVVVKGDQSDERLAKLREAQRPSPDHDSVCVDEVEN